MIKPGDRVTLTGVSKHGKNRIQRDGSEFIVLKILSQINTVAHKSLPGPFLFVSNVDKLGDNRWVAIKNDPDFDVEIK